MSTDTAPLRCTKHSRAVTVSQSIPWPLGYERARTLGAVDVLDAASATAPCGGPRVCKWHAADGRASIPPDGAPRGSRGHGEWRALIQKATEGVLLGAYIKDI